MKYVINYSITILSVLLKFELETFTRYVPLSKLDKSIEVFDSTSFKKNYFTNNIGNFN